MMARTSKVEKARTRRRLVTTASREFRANGVAGTSIPRVMERVGLTQGTFYAHFASKEALMAEAVGAGLVEVVDRLLGSTEGAAPTHELAAIIALYLNAEHRDEVQSGCVLPALAGEIRREPELVRQAFTEELGRFFKRLAPLLPDEDADACMDHGLVLIAGMAGALLLARAVNDPALSDQILRAAREYYTKAFTPRREATTSSSTQEASESQ